MCNPILRGGVLFGMKAQNKHTASPGNFRIQTVKEEIANSIIHGLGVLLAIAGLIVMRLQSEFGPRLDYLIYPATMILMFLASTLYHAIQQKEIKKILRIADHSAIYLLIAGTYTPFCVLSLRGAWGWAILSFEWGLAIIGIILYLSKWKYHKKIELWVYLLMGWAIVVGLRPLMQSVSWFTIGFLIFGGILYTLGTLWYKRPQVIGAHVTWHVFVLAGAACHWGAVWSIL